MKKIYSALLLACMALTAFAQEGNDTTYVMFDFNENPWNYPVTTAMTRNATADFEADGTGILFEETDFPWPIAEGADKKVVITVYPTDLNEYNKATGYAYCEENNDGVTGVEHPKYNMLFTSPGTMMRFKAPEGYKFGKMVFYFYKSSYFLLDTEEEIEVVRDGVTHKDKFYIWIPTTPKVNKNNLDCWEGDETNILFNAISYFKGNFKKIDIRLVPDGTAGISAQKTEGLESSSVTALDGRMLNKDSGLRKGVYIQNGKKVIVK